MVRGFLLNNQLTDFDFMPGGAERGRGRQAAAQQHGADHRVLSGQQPGLAIGSPGGSMIINYVAKALVGTLDWRLDVQAAIELPNFGSRNGPTLLEQGSRYEALRRELEQRGHQVEAFAAARAACTASSACRAAGAAAPTRGARRRPGGVAGKFYSSRASRSCGIWICLPAVLAPPFMGCGVAVFPSRILVAAALGGGSAMRKERAARSSALRAKYIAVAVAAAFAPWSVYGQTPAPNQMPSVTVTQGTRPSTRWSARISGSTRRRSARSTKGR